MTDRRNDAWFAPKIFGIGAGFPIAWQGWALLLAYIAVLGGCVALVRTGDNVGEPLGYALLVLSTAAMMVVARSRTRGGWRWRWGRDDRA